MDTFENIREVFTCIKEFVDGITPEGAYSTAKAVSNLEISDETEKKLDETIQNQRATTKKIKNLSKIEKTVDGLIERFQKKP